MFATFSETVSALRRIRLHKIKSAGKKSNALDRPGVEIYITEKNEWIDIAVAIIA